MHYQFHKKIVDQVVTENPETLAAQQPTLTKVVLFLLMVVAAPLAIFPYLMSGPGIAYQTSLLASLKEE